MKLILSIILFSFICYGQTTYYVKNGGNNNLAGTSDATAWATIAKVNSFSFPAGSIIRFKRGDTFTDATLTIPTNGTSGNVITFTNYGTGDLPIINAITSSLVYGIKINTNYITIDGLKVYGSAVSGTQYGIRIDGNNINIINCEVVGGNGSRSSVNINGIGIGGNSRNIDINGNYVSGFSYGIQYNGVQGHVWTAPDYLYIRNNNVFDCYNTSGITDAIRVIGGIGTTVCNFNHRAIVSNNRVWDFGENAFDFQGAAGVITEYNEAWQPKEGIVRGETGTTSFCKMGAAPGHPSYNMIFRYNIYHDDWTRQSPSGNWNSGMLVTGTMISGEIYYNLCYNIYGAGYTASGLSDYPYPDSTVKVYNNTFITASTGIQVWGSTNFKLDIKNNIIVSGDTTATDGKPYSYDYPRNSVETNQIWHGTDGYTYSDPPDYVFDIRYQPTSSSARTTVDANILDGVQGNILNVNSSTHLMVGQTKSNLFNNDPLFTDKPNNDYTLTGLSTGIDYGIDIGLTEDILGNSISGNPDLGTYEYESPTPGIAPTLSNFFIGALSSTILEGSATLDVGGASTNVYLRSHSSGSGGVMDSTLIGSFTTNGLKEFQQTGLAANTKFYRSLSAINSAGFNETNTDSATTLATDEDCPVVADNLLNTGVGCYETSISGWTASSGVFSITNDTVYQGVGSLKANVADSVFARTPSLEVVAGGTNTVIGTSGEITNTSYTQVEFNFTAATTIYERLFIRTINGTAGYLELRSAGDLTEDLIPGKTYKFTCRVKLSEGGKTIYLDNLVLTKVVEVVVSTKRSVLLKRKIVTEE